MSKKLIIVLFLFLFIFLFMSPAVMAKNKNIEIKADEDMNRESEAKELSGMSIVGNDEAPKSLYIVPWKSSEIGLETDLKMLLEEKAEPVDRDVFKRELEFYELSKNK